MRRVIVLLGLATHAILTVSVPSLLRSEFQSQRMIGFVRLDAKTPVAFEAKVPCAEPSQPRFGEPVSKSRFSECSARELLEKGEVTLQDGRRVIMPNDPAYTKK